MSENINTYIFTYGTLKRNFPNHHFLANLENKLYNGKLAKSQFVSKAKTKELFPLIIGTICGIPFILDEPGIGKVYYYNARLILNIKQYNIIIFEGSHNIIMILIFNTRYYNIIILSYIIFCVITFIPIYTSFYIFYIASINKFSLILNICKLVS